MDWDKFMWALTTAFDIAEQHTANQFDGKTCTMHDKNGDDVCPICYFRIEVKEWLEANFKAEFEDSKR